MCRACQQPHKASDYNFPAKAKAEQSAISRHTNNLSSKESHIRPILTQEPEDLIRFQPQALQRLSDNVLNLYILLLPQRLTI
jgi:hypothetical protein